jgi:stage V sporulation protein G
MPSRKLTDHCPKCRGKNHLRAKFCNDCGAKLQENRVSDEDVQGKLHADIAHPINSECRARIQEAILQAYREELRRAGRAGEAEAVVAQPEPEMREGEAGGEQPSETGESESPKGPDDSQGGQEERRFGDGIL